MIDIAQVVQAIVKTKDASDAKAYKAHVHGLVRQYGQELVLNIAQAVAPTTPEETEIVKWLQQQLVAIATQIPEHKQE